MNSVVLCGRITKDLELKRTQGGIAYCNFTLAINRIHQSNSGEKIVDYPNCVVWREKAENLCKYMKKGSLLGITGELTTRSYDGNDGKKVYITEVLCDNVHFLENKNSSHQDTSQYQAPKSEYKQQEQNLESAFKEDNNVESDLPF